MGSSSSGSFNGSPKGADPTKLKGAGLFRAAGHVARISTRFGGGAPSAPTSPGSRTIVGKDAVGSQSVRSYAGSPNVSRVKSEQGFGMSSSQSLPSLTGGGDVAFPPSPAYVRSFMRSVYL